MFNSAGLGWWNNSFILLLFYCSLAVFPSFSLFVRVCVWASCWVVCFCLFAIQAIYLFSFTHNTLTHLIRYFDPTESVNSRDGLLSLDKFHYLDVPQIDVLMVYDDLECIFNCVDHPLCMSVNLAAEEKLWCELLSSDKENSTKKYYQNESSHHYYFPVRKYRQN